MKFPIYLFFIGILTLLCQHSHHIHALPNQYLDDSVKIDQLNNKAWSYRNNHPDSTLFYAQKAFLIADSINAVEQLIQSHNYIGIAHRNLGNFTRAFESYMAAFKLSEKYNNEAQRGYSLINLGNLALYQSDFEGSLDYFKEGLATAIQQNDSSMTAYCYLNLGRAYRALGEYEIALNQFEYTLGIREAMNDTEGIITTEIDMAEVFRLDKDFEQSLDYYNRSIDRALKTDNQSAAVYCFNNIALIYHDMGNYEESRRYANLSLQKAKEINSKNDQRKAMLTLSKVNEATGKFEEALTYHQNYTELNEEIFGEENIRKVERLRAQYENEKKEAENKYLKEQAKLNEEIISRQQTIIILIGAGIVLLLVVAILSYYAFITKSRLSKKIEGQKLQIEKDRDLIEAQSKKLEALDKAKSRFFANISHDLRSPLALIMGNIENIKLEEGNHLTVNAQEDLEIIERNSRRLLNLTDEINDLTKLEEGKLKLHREKIAYKQFVAELVNLFKSSAELKGIDLIYKDEEEFELEANIDTRQFEKVLFNLISNAFKHSHRGDSIQVILSYKNGQIHTKVADTGEGIAQDSLPHIFDRFYQSPNKHYQSREGLGIGLALVKEIVDLHEGRISVASELGVGTTFTVTVPGNKVYESDALRYFENTFSRERSELLTNDSKQDNAPRNKLVPGFTDDQREAILVVEDHSELRAYVRDLISEDYKVLEAGHGKEALQILEKHKVDLIITDLMMPWMDGFELLEALGEDEVLKKIPVLVISARTTDEDKERVLFQGINEFLQKPFNKHELLQRVKNLLAQKDKWYNNTPAQLLDKRINDIEHIEIGLLKKIDSLIVNSIADSNLSVAMLADTMAASERQVYRMIKKLTAMTPLEYIREVRLRFADELIRKGKVKNATEAAREIGMKNVTQFNQLYEKRFGKKPVELLN